MRNLLTILAIVLLVAAPFSMEAANTTRRTIVLKKTPRNPNEQEKIDRRMPSPILICGTDKDDPSKGHQWVVDGSMYVYYFENNNDTATYTDRYLYFVWGWGGSCNAYYLAGSTTPDYGWLEDPYGPSVVNDHSYFNLIYYGNFTPNKQN